MRSWIFVVSMVSLGVVQAAPPPGHPTIDQASEIMGIDRQAAVLYRGQVLEALDSNAYTYIRVKTGAEGSQWLAAPRRVLQPGQQVGYSQGVLMRRFYSKKLKRTFDRVLFVPRVELFP